jgi:signal peptidase I
MSNFFFILIVIARLAVVSPFMVEGESMLPTMHENDLFLIETNLQVADDLQRGDIVVFSFDDEYFYVKRVIGLPGETVKIEDSFVEIKRGETYKKLNEPYLMGESYDYGDERFFIVPEGEFFVMGDNRGHSKDSRTFKDPYISFEDIGGRQVY